MVERWKKTSKVAVGLVKPLIWPHPWNAFYLSINYAALHENANKEEI